MEILPEYSTETANWVTLFLETVIKDSSAEKVLDVSMIPSHHVHICVLSRLIRLEKFEICLRTK